MIQNPCHSSSDSAEYVLGFFFHYINHNKCCCHYNGVSKAFEKILALVFNWTNYMFGKEAKIGKL